MSQDSKLGRPLSPCSKFQDNGVKFNNGWKLKQLDSRNERKILKRGRISAKKFWVGWDPAKIKAQFDK